MVGEVLQPQVAHHSRHCRLWAVGQCAGGDGQGDQQQSVQQRMTLALGKGSRRHLRPLSGFCAFCKHGRAVSEVHPNIIHSVAFGCLNGSQFVAYALRTPIAAKLPSGKHKSSHAVIIARIGPVRQWVSVRKPLPVGWPAPSGCAFDSTCLC